jgi:iron complex outermembrane receptor protein
MFTSFGAASALFAITPAFAQSSAANGTASGQASPAAAPKGAEEIVVTAQRVETRLSRTPVSVTVLSGTALAKRQIVTEDDLRSAAPGLQIRSGSSSNQLNYALRGESEDPFSNVRPGVLPYVNDVQVGGAGGSSTFYDLQSIQVLKGPQGTLFGRSATGGAVLFTTAKPTDTYSGYISGLYGDYNSQKAEGAVNMPLVGDKLILRIAGFERSRDGYQYNLYDNKTVGDQRQDGFRVSLAAKITPDLRNDFVLDYSHSDSQNMVAVLGGLQPYTGHGAPYIPIQYLYSGTATPAATFTGECTLQEFVGLGPCTSISPAVAGFYNSYFANPNHPANGIGGQLAEQQARGPYIVDSDAPDVFHTHNLIITNTTSYNLSDSVQLKNIVGYVGINSFVVQETDGTPYNASTGAGLNNNTRQISEEFQVLGNLLDDRLKYVTGFYYSNERATTAEVSSFFDILFGGLSQENNFRISNNTFAGYGQATYKITDSGLSATAGARYTSEDVGFQSLPADSFLKALGTPAPPGFSYDQNTTYNRVSWTLGLQQQIGPDLMVYANGSRAYKSGGYNGIVEPKVGYADVSGNAFKAEEVTEAEYGTKYAGLLDNMRTYANMAVFYNWITNSQRAAFTLLNGAPAGLTVNVPQGTTYGLELDGSINPLKWLKLGGTFNYTHAQFGEQSVTVNGAPQGFDIVPDTPKFTGSVFGDITYPIKDEFYGDFHVELYRQSVSYTSPQASDIEGTVLKPYSVLNFEFGLQDTRRNLALTVNLKNALNKTYYAGGVATGPIYQVNLLVPAEPRTVSVELKYKF